MHQPPEVMTTGEWKEERKNVGEAHEEEEEEDEDEDEDDESDDDDSDEEDDEDSEEESEGDDDEGEDEDEEEGEDEEEEEEEEKDEKETKESEEEEGEEEENATTTTNQETVEEEDEGGSFVGGPPLPLTSKQGTAYGAHIKVLCLNTYLVPPAVTWNPHLWAPFWSCRDPAGRSVMIGKLSKWYDLICLQEVWGTRLNRLYNPLAATHSILPETQGWSTFGFLNEIVDPVRMYQNKTGGLWFAWRRSKMQFLSFDRMHFAPDSVIPFSNQNVTMVELDASAIFPNKRLFVFNTHFCVFGIKAKISNITTLQEFVSLCLWKTYLQNLSVNKSMQYSESSSYLSDVAVLILGDFNIDFLRMVKTYKRLKTLNGSCEMRDLFLPPDNPSYKNQTTYHTQEAITQENPTNGNSLFPWPFSGRVDYIFGLDTLTLKPKDVAKLMTTHSPAHVLGEEYEHMNIPLSHDGSLTLGFCPIYCLGMDILTQEQGSEYSDHWPLSAKIALGLNTLNLPKPDDYTEKPKYPFMPEGEGSATFTSSSEITEESTDEKPEERDDDEEEEESTPDSSRPRTVWDTAKEEPSTPSLPPTLPKNVDNFRNMRRVSSIVSNISTSSPAPLNRSHFMAGAPGVTAPPERARRLFEQRAPREEETNVSAAANRAKQTTTQRRDINNIHSTGGGRGAGGMPRGLGGGRGALR